MKFPTVRNITVALIIALSAAGCYTQLMTPQEFVQTQRYQSKKTFSDNSYSVNYNQSCVSCHSVNELNERYDELSQLGVMTVHNGISLNPSHWENTMTAHQPIILYPSPEPFWPGPYSPVNPWWAPPVINSGPFVPQTGANGGKIRDNGGTRDGNRNGDRTAPISTPTYSQPPSTGSSSTPIPATPPPILDSTPSAPPAQTGERSRDSNSSSGSTNKTRDNGSSRDDSGNRPR